MAGTGRLDVKDAPALIACGILEKEIRFLMDKNGWDVAVHFLPSQLHVDFDLLRNSLERCLEERMDRECVLFYGACHPLMDRIVTSAGGRRTPGQNCVDIYLGHELFCRELEQGAFFLFEDWALHWKRVIQGVMPGNPEVMRSIFRSAHKYLLAITTPCSGDFRAEAAAVSEVTDLELRWLAVGLDRLEAALSQALELPARKGL